MFVADLHNDLVQRIMEGEDVTKQTLNGHTDIPRLKESCINLQILIIWVSSKSSNPDFLKKLIGCMIKLKNFLLLRMFKYLKI